VEVDPDTSNQHEINGVRGFRQLFGDVKRAQLATRFVYLAEPDDEPIVDDGFVSWYDSRENQPKRSAEFRLYYSSPLICDHGAENDILAVLLRADETCVFVVAKKDSTAAGQLTWLLGLHLMSQSGQFLLTQRTDDQTSLPTAFLSRSVS
jgi:hypothetical protein